MISWSQIAKLSFIILGLGSCQFYSSVEPPKMNPHQEYLTQVNFGGKTHFNFFEQFEDEDLISLINLAIKNNQDLKIAIEKISEFESFYSIEASKSYPGIQLDVDAQRTRSSKSGFSEVQGTPFAIGAGANKSIVTNIFIQAFNLNWEIDLFGRIRNSKKRAQAQIEEMKEEEKSVYLTLVSDVAVTYFALQTYAKLIDITKNSLATLNQVASLNQSRFDRGIDPTQSLLNYEKEIADLNQVLLDLDQSYQVYCNHMSRLVGEEPSKFNLKSKNFKFLTSDQLFLKVYLPSELLRNRPDIRVAEKQLIQSGYSVKIAQADLFPTFSLLGAFGFASPQAPTWFTHSNSFWSLGPTVRWPVFQGFQYLSQLNVQKSRQRQAALHYESVFLKALEEVENSLVGFFNQEKIAKEAITAYTYQTKIYAANSNLTCAGIRSQEYDLNQKIVLYDQQKKMIVEEFKTFQNLIQLYKAVGGEWK